MRPIRSLPSSRLALLGRRRHFASRPVAAVASLALAAAASACALASPAAAQPAPLAHPAAAATQLTAPTSQPEPPVTVTVDPNAPGSAVPQRFLGLSFEAAALRRIAQYAHRGDLVRLLRSLGPGVLRFGGITADENVAWTDAATPTPAWATSTIDAADMRALGKLARRSDWKVLLTVGIAHDEPVAAAREVAAAHAALGPYLAAVEIGNEPNAYGRHGFRALPWIAQGYEEEVSEYREAIARLTLDVPIAGPDVSGSGVFGEWGEEEALSQRPALLTGHHYPLGCAQTPPPSIESLLSPAIRGREAQSLQTYMRISSTYRIPLRIDEAGSVSCGGVPGISDTFASALWATAYILQTMDAGAAGINLQGNPTNCAGYTPLCAPDPAAVSAGALRAQPEWYALLLTHSLAGLRPLPATISTAGGLPAPNLVASAFAGTGHSQQVVLVDDEPPNAAPLTLTLDTGLPTGTTAGAMRLTAPAQSATADVLLADRAVLANGSWGAPARTETIPAHAGSLSVTIAPSSATLLTIQPPVHRSARAHRR
jgi:hypothetical protein